MPVSHNETETPMATIPSGIRLDMKATTASARMTNVVATGLMRATLARCAGASGPVPGTGPGLGSGQPTLGATRCPAKPAC